MAVWSCDLTAATADHRCHRCRPGCAIQVGPSGRRWSTDAAPAGLRWLTGRWPGGTIGNEAEVYSG